MCNAIVVFIDLIGLELTSRELAEAAAAAEVADFGIGFGLLLTSE